MCQVVMKMPGSMRTMCRTVSTYDSPMEWVSEIQDLHMQGWKVRINGKAAKWHHPSTWKQGAPTSVHSQHTLLKGGGAVGMTAEQQMDHMLQMMSQTQTEMQQGQSDTRADMNAMYGELKSIREEQLEAKRPQIPWLRG